MTVFQGFFLTALGAVIVAELWALWRGVLNWHVNVFRLAVWTAAAVAIAAPGLTQVLARAIGIDRGADLVAYLFALSFLGTSFYFYSRYIRLQRQITQIVRHLALENAGQGDDSGNRQ